MKDQTTLLMIQALWKSLHGCRKGPEKLLGEEKRAAHLASLHPLHSRGGRRKTYGCGTQQE